MIDQPTSGKEVLMFLLILLVLAVGAMYAIGASSPDWSLLLPQNQADEVHPVAEEAVQQNGHAEEAHPDTAEYVRSCFNKYGSSHIFYNPNTQRYLEVCFLENGKYGVRITEKIGDKLEEVTAFAKDKFKTWKQMAQYIENGGYTNQVK